MTRVGKTQLGMIGGALVALATLAAPTAAREVSCRIEQGGRVVMERPCDFQAEGRDGSFSLSSRTGRPLFGGISVISISVIEPGVAEVRGLTQDGINSRWGVARRSQRDGACWQGDDFRVCAY